MHAALMAKLHGQYAYSMLLPVKSIHKSVCSSECDSVCFSVRYHDKVDGWLWRDLLTNMPPALSF